MAGNNPLWGQDAYRRLDVHIYDYLIRRGYYYAANSLMSEAGIPCQDNQRAGTMLINLGVVLDDLYILVETIRSEPDRTQRNYRVNQLLGRLSRVNFPAPFQGSISNGCRQIRPALPRLCPTNSGSSHFQSNSSPYSSSYQASFDGMSSQNTSLMRTLVERDLLLTVGRNTESNPRKPHELLNLLDDTTELRLSTGDWTAGDGCKTAVCTAPLQPTNLSLNEQPKENGRKRKELLQGGSGSICIYDSATLQNDRVNCYCRTPFSSVQDHDIGRPSEIPPNRTIALPTPTLETNGNGLELRLGPSIPREDRTSGRMVLKQEEDELPVSQGKSLALADQKQKQLFSSQQTQEGQGKQQLYGSSCMTWAGNASGHSSAMPPQLPDHRSRAQFFAPGSSSKRHKGDDGTDGEPPNFFRRL